MNWLAERGVQCVSSTMLAQGGKYDNYHLHDHQFNRKLVYRFLRGAITLHLKYMEIIMTKRDDLHHYVESLVRHWSASGRRSCCCRRLGWLRWWCSRARCSRSAPLFNPSHALVALSPVPTSPSGLPP